MLWLSLRFLDVERGLLEITSRRWGAWEGKDGHAIPQLSAGRLDAYRRGVGRRMDRDSKQSPGSEVGLHAPSWPAKDEGVSCRSGTS